MSKERAKRHENHNKRRKNESAKVSYTKSRSHSGPRSENVVSIKKGNPEAATKKIQLIPKNTKQEEYIEYLNDNTKRVVFATGPAGTGKTLLATLKAIEMLRDGVVKKILIARPAVAVDGEDHGFLPGSLIEKLEPWTKPIIDVFLEFYAHSELLDMFDRDIIELSPIGLMRGRTFKNCAVIIDESQNLTITQAKMALTRLGQGSRCFVTGDLNQTDRDNSIEENGLADIADRLSRYKSSLFAQVQFARDDCERDEVCSAILEMYGDDD